MLHGLPSLQVPPLVGVWTQPLGALQVSVVQGLLSSQGSSFWPMQVPPRQTDSSVQASPSSQAARSAMGTTMQRWLSFSHKASLHAVVAKLAQSLSARQFPPASTVVVTSLAASTSGPCVGLAVVSTFDPPQAFAISSKNIKGRADLQGIQTACMRASGRTVGRSRRLWLNP